MSGFSFRQPNGRSASRKDSRNNTGGGDGIPFQLTKYDQWLVTHDTPWDEATHKAPKYPSKGWNNGDLLTFISARQRSEGEKATGIAFCFTDQDPFIGFDLDDVQQEDTFTDEALEIVHQLDSYTELSSSGTGLHVVVEGERLDDRKTRGELSTSGHLEVYDKNRYFVLTGDVYDDRPSVEQRRDAVRAVQETHLPTRSQFAFRNRQRKPDFDRKTMAVTPEQVRRTIRAYVKHGEVDETPLRLWDGNNQSYQSSSEADMAFVKQLYFWCGGDRRLMDDCFRASRRYGMRPQSTPKWDEVHHSDGTTYGDMTIQKVCETNSSIFSGRYVK